MAQSALKKYILSGSSVGINQYLFYNGPKLTPSVNSYQHSATCSKIGDNTVVWKVSYTPFSGQFVLNRFEMGGGGQYMMSHQVTYASSNDNVIGITVLGDYIYISYNVSGSRNIVRFNASDLTSPTGMSISGTSFSASNASGCFSDGTYLYFNDSSPTDARKKFSVSGTTLTYIGNIVYSSMDGNNAYCDGTYVYFLDASGTYIQRFTLAGTYIDQITFNLRATVPSIDVSTGIIGVGLTYLTQELLYIHTNVAIYFWRAGAGPGEEVQLGVYLSSVDKL